MSPQPTLIDGREPSAAGIPLCCDLDGTLLRSDMFYESLVRVLRSAPWVALCLPWWLLRGKAYLNEQLATRCSLDPALLPYDQPLVEWLREQRRSGRRLVLATATHQRLAAGIAGHLGLFDEIIATDGEQNVRGRRKASRLEARFGPHGFDYAGDSREDLPVWQASRAAVVAGAAPSLLSRVRRMTTVEKVFPRPAAGPGAWLRALRLHQWSKNLLVFLSILTSHQFAGPGLVATAWTFVAFCLCASGIYLLNDLVDLDHDRQHELKRNRALASGAIPIRSALLVAPLLLAAGAAVAASVSGVILGVLVAYAVASTAYSLYLKSVLLVDVFTLSLLYTLRVIGGHISSGVPFSPWFSTFMVFFFLSLALCKRVSELHPLVENHAQSAAPGRAYLPGDIWLLKCLGVSSGFLASVVLGLYVDSPRVVGLYSRPYLLWCLVPLLVYWISRVWMVAHRGAMSEDPVWFALKDRQSHLLGLAAAVILLLATIR